MRIRKILAAVADSGKRSQRVVTKAAQLAHATGARLELYHALSSPLYADPVVVGSKTLQELQADMQTEHLKRLERIARPLRAQGLKVNCSASWDFPAPDAIVRHALANRCDLIVADSPSRERRWYLRFTDWELLRVSPVPVLLVRNNKTYASPVILAALDPLHAAGKPAHLDAEILAAATSLQKALKGSIHAVHAYLPSRVGLQPSEMRRDDLAEHLEDRARTRAQRAVAAELKAAKVKGATIHLVPRHPEDAIPAAAHKTRAAITVMGAISRSGLKRLFIGNTAEQVIQALRSDVLIIKPRRFAKLLQQRARGADIRPLALPDYV